MMARLLVLTDYCCDIGLGIVGGGGASGTTLSDPQSRRVVRHQVYYLKCFSDGFKVVS